MATTSVGTTTYTGPDPGAGQYGILANAAHLAFTNAQTDIQNRRSSLYKGSGVQSDGNGSFQIDPNGDGSYQAMMRGNAQQGAADTAAINALGYGGGLQRQQQEAAQSAYSQNATNWLQSTQGADFGLNAELTNAKNTESGTDFQSLMTDIQSAIGAGQFNPANYSGITIPGYDVQGDLAGIAPSQVADPGNPTGGAFGSNTGHKFYDQYVNAGGKLSLAKWLASGTPGNRAKP